MSEAAVVPDSTGSGAVYPFDPVAECQRLLDLRAKVQAGVFPKFFIASSSQRPEERPLSRQASHPLSAYDERSDYRPRHELEAYRPYPAHAPREALRDEYHPEELKRKRPEWDAHLAAENERMKRRPSPEYRGRDPYMEQRPAPVPYSTSDHPPPPVPTGSRHDEYGRLISSDPRYPSHLPPPPPPPSYGRSPVPSYYDQPPRAHQGGSVQMSAALLPAGIIIEDGYTRDTQRGYELFIPSAAKKGRYLPSSINPAPVAAPYGGGYDPRYAAAPAAPSPAPFISHWPPYAADGGPEQHI